MNGGYEHIGAPPAGPRGPVRRRWVSPVLLGLAISAALLGAVGLAYSLGRNVAAEPVKAPTTSTVTGSVTLDRPGTFTWDDNPESCWGIKSYADIAPGTRVAITDSAGKTVALGRLGAGVVTRQKADPSRAAICTHNFTVENVPTGLGFYGIELADRGVSRYSEADLRSPVVFTAY